MTLTRSHLLLAKLVWPIRGEITKGREVCADHLFLAKWIGDDVGMDEAVRDYIGAIDPEYRPLFDRLHRLILEVHPDAAVVLSYKMPTYKVGRRRLPVGVWRHGLSLYGWGEDRAAAFTENHPQLKTSKGTIQLRLDDAANIPDDEFRSLIRAALAD